METKDLERQLKTLDQRVLAVGQNIQNMRVYINQCYSQADNLEVQAQYLLNSVSSSEDASVISQMYNQASAYMNQAAAYRMQAENQQSQVDALVTELRGYKGNYQSYMEMGQANLQELAIASNKLASAGGRYGAEKIQEALAAVNQRKVYNQNLIYGCQKRMAWIDQICGSGDDPQKQKVLRR